MRNLWILLAFFLGSGSLQAQSFFQVSIPSGTQHFVGNSVTVVPHPLAGLHSSCGTGPYTIHAEKSGYTFLFDRPVNRIRAALTNLNIGERIGFYINGNFFYVTPGHLSPYGGTCILGLSQAINGYVTEINAGASTAAMVDIEPGFKIDSISIVHEDYDAQGTHFSFFFEGDPQVLISEPYQDSLHCRTDSIWIPYHVNLHFNNNNQFIAELSDPQGDFSNPRTLGAVVDVGTGQIPAYLPDDLPLGKGYRIRVRATDPPRISAPTQISLSLDRYPPISLSSNSPVCLDHPIALHAQVDSGVQVRWEGPMDFLSTETDPLIPQASLQREGKYYLRAERNGCQSLDSLSITTKPTPIITGIKNSSPVCEGEGVLLSAEVSAEDVDYLWTGPQGFRSTQAAPVISSARPQQGGEYRLEITRAGCTSLPASTELKIDPRPVISSIRNNSRFDSPLFAGARAELEAIGTPEADYIWTGPNGFTAEGPLLVFEPVTSANQGKYTVLASIGVCRTMDSTELVIRNRKQYSQYPNPSDQGFEFFTFVEKPQVVHYRLIDLMGRVVFQNSQSVNQGYIRAEVPTSGLTEGLYFFDIKVDEETFRLKIQVAH